MTVTALLSQCPRLQWMVASSENAIKNHDPLEKSVSLKSDRSEKPKPGYGWWAVWKRWHFPCVLHSFTMNCQFQMMDWSLKGERQLHLVPLLDSYLEVARDHQWRLWGICRCHGTKVWGLAMDRYWWKRCVAQCCTVALCCIVYKLPGIYVPN